MRTETSMWTDDLWANARVLLVEQLRQHRATIVFRKVDGTERTMQCTLIPADLPVLAENREVERAPRAVNAELLSVFDLEKQEWRSMRIRNIISIEI